MSWFSSRKNEAPVLDRKQIALNKAATALDMAALRQALLLGADPSGGSEVAISPLVAASVSIQAWLNNSDTRQQDVIIALLDAGARPDWAGRDGKSPYELALRHGWVRVVAKMLEKGLDPNRIGLAGPTPLQVVFTVSEYKRWPLVPLVDLLLSRGADASLPSKQQPAPLILGMRNPNLETAPDLEQALEALVDAGGVPAGQAEDLATQALEHGWESLAQAIAAAPVPEPPAN